MQTKIQSNHISSAEKWLGYGLGPGRSLCLPEEQYRSADLKAKCARKGLNLDTENRKYLEKVAKKGDKKARKIKVKN